MRKEKECGFSPNTSGGKKRPKDALKSMHATNKKSAKNTYESDVSCLSVVSNFNLMYIISRVPFSTLLYCFIFCLLAPK